MKYLYKYPQSAYPYDDIVKTNRHRNRFESEYELLDTGVFNQNRYFDVFVEYAKESPEDILIKITVCNRGHEAASLHVLPTLWFRNTWSWSDNAQKPLLKEVNEANRERIFGSPNKSPYVKDGINNYIVHGKTNAVNPDKAGTKVSAHYVLKVGGGETNVIKLRLTDKPPSSEGGSFGSPFDDVFEARKSESDEFYNSITPSSASEDAKNVMRQVLSGMLWSKQYYFFDGNKWLEEHGADPFALHPRPVRNREWAHMINDHVISMPDKWEYPWYAAWDLAFHAIALAGADVNLAKQQLEMLLREIYLHPSGQIPAYEWNFSDVNPPVHA